MGASESCPRAKHRGHRGRSSPHRLRTSDLAAFERAGRYLERVGVGHRKDHYPAHLSGGEVRRVALAMALVNGPELLLADEMTGELDAANAAAVMRLVMRESQERGLTLLFTTHSTTLADLAQRRFTLDAGCVAPT